MAKPETTVREAMKKGSEEFGGPPRVFFDEDEENYWVGWKSHGGAMETHLASGMPRWFAKWLLLKLTD